MKSSAELLRDHKLRVTAARVAVLEVLAEQSHLTTDDVAAAVRRRIGAVSTQAVYHVLSTLTSAGLLRRFELAGGAARYERRVGDNHHHLVCRPCGEVTDVDCDAEDRPCMAPPDRPGYQIDQADVVFWGVCPRCHGSPSAHDNTGHDNTGHDNAGHDNAGHDNAGHHNTSHHNTRSLT